MTTKSTKAQDIKNRYEQIAGSLSEKDQLELDTKILLARFLSEIQKLMDAQGMSKKELAAQIGTSPSFVTQLFCGDKIINLQTLAKIQQVYQVNFKVEAERQEQEYIPQFLVLYPEENFNAADWSSSDPFYVQANVVAEDPEYFNKGV